MGDPYDYTTQFRGLPNPQQAFATGYNTGSAMLAPVIAQQKAQAEAEAEAKRQTYMSQLIARVTGPTSTAQDYAELANLVDPKTMEQIRGSIQDQDQASQQRSLQQAVPIFAALQGGHSDVAMDLMAQLAEGKRNAGDEAGAQFWTTMAQSVETDPKYAQQTIGMMIPLYGEQGLKAMDSILAQNKQPHEIQEIDAKTALANAQAALAQWKMDHPGKVDPDKIPEFEQSLRKEYLAQTEKFLTIQDQYRNILNADPNGVGDLDLIYGYMKMLDPRSVVRGEEADAATQASGKLSYIANLYNSLLKGDKLPPETRKQIVAQTKKLYEGALVGEKTTRDGLTRIAKENGVNPENIFYLPEGPVAPEVISQKEAPVPKDKPKDKPVTMFGTDSAGTQPKSSNKRETVEGL